MNQMTFDLALLDEDDRPLVEAATRRLHELERRTGEAIVEIGRTLIEVKARLGHGRFGQWLGEEFGWSYPTANRFMSVAERLGEISQIENFAPSALYALASGNVSDAIRDEFIQKAEAGEQVRHKDVQERLASERRPPLPAPSVAVVQPSLEVVEGEIVEDFDDEPVPFEVLDQIPPPPPSRNHSNQMTPTPTSFIPPLTGGGAKVAAVAAERHGDAVIAERVSKVTGPVSLARAQLVELRKYPRYKEVISENTELQEEMRDSIREMSALSADLRAILGEVTTPTLRRVS